MENSDDYVEARLDGVGFSTIRKLRRGQFTIQDTINLRGLTRAEAKEALAAFLRRSAAAGRRSLLVVHGRGLNSAGQIPILKRSVAKWLTKGALSRWTLAYCTARPVDGGAGAIYLLLRSKPRRR